MFSTSSCCFLSDHVNGKHAKFGDLSKQSLVSLHQWTFATFGETNKSAGLQVCKNERQQDFNSTYKTNVFCIECIVNLNKEKGTNCIAVYLETRRMRKNWTSNQNKEGLLAPKVVVECMHGAEHNWQIRLGCYFASAFHIEVIQRNQTFVTSLNQVDFGFRLFQGCKLSLIELIKSDWAL